MTTVNTKVKSALIKGIKFILELAESLPGKNFVNVLICRVRNILIPGTTMFDMMDEIKSFAANAIIIADAYPIIFYKFLKIIVIIIVYKHLKKILLS